MAGAEGAEERKARSDSLRPENRARFLEGLAETCHVGRSAALAGKKDPTSFYRLRNRDPQFAAEWDAAIAVGIARVEAALIARAVATVEAQQAADGTGDAGTAPARPLELSEVIQLLRYQRDGAGRERKQGPKRRYASPEETDAALLARLDGLEARVKARAAREKAGRAAARKAAKEGEACPEGS